MSEMPIMHQELFTMKKHLVRLAALLMAVVLMATVAEGAGTPTARISSLSTDGMAPFTVHVHGLDTTLREGDPLSALYEWDFDDPSGDYNTLVGWNAAHIYDAPGTYTIVLKVTNEAGLADEATLQILVTEDSRETLYVAEHGDDDNSGLSTSQPLKTYAHALGRAGDNTTILFKRGDLFAVPAQVSLHQYNCVIGAYGSGARPEIRWTGGLGYSVMLGLTTEESVDIVVQDLNFDSVYDWYSGRDVVDAIRMGGTNLTVRDCSFGHVTMCLNTNLDPVGVLSYGNDAVVEGGVRAYYLWGEGTDHTHLGNTVSGSTHEHVIRFGGLTRALIGYNDLRNDDKRTIWCMSGQYGYVVGNMLRDGRVTVGPDHVGGSAATRFKWAVLDANEIDHTSAVPSAVEIESGAEHVMTRNNVIHTNGGSTITISGYSSAYNRTTIDTRVYNNTGILRGTGGRFLRCEPGAVEIGVENNLYAAPRLISGDNRFGNVYIEGSNLSNFTHIRNNVWAIPDGFSWADDAYHYLWPTWPNIAGYKSIAQWAALSGTSNEAYEVAELDDAYEPLEGTIAEAHAQPVAGVMTDFNGGYRPTSGAWSAGAVDVNATGAQDPPPPPPPPPGDDDRVTEGLVALWSFEEGDGATVLDVSGVAPALNLTIRHPDRVSWIDGGLNITGSTLISSDSAAGKIAAACRMSHEVTIEAWVKPANTSQSGPARMVTMSANPAERDFTLGQSGGAYDVRLRSTGTDLNGIPSLSSANGVASAQLMHVLYTRESDGDRVLYINGVETSSSRQVGTLSNWNSSYKLGFGNEMDFSRPWRGEMHLVAVYGRALSADEAVQNYAAGPNDDSPPPPPPPPPPSEDGDINGDGVVNEDDVCQWHVNPVDLNGDGDADPRDLLIILDAMEGVFDDCNGNNIPDACEGITEAGWKKAGSAAPDGMLSPIAISGDTAVIGWNKDSSVAVNGGAVYVYRRVNGIWTYEAKLRSPEVDAGDHFGWSVALDGNHLLIGAHRDSAAGSYTGAVHYFRRSVDTWTWKGRLTPADAISDQRFGFALAMDNSVAIIGSHGDREDGLNTGAAYIFRRSGSAWVQEQKLLAPDGDSGDKFGRSVGVSGSRVIVGAPWHDGRGTDAGAVYAFAQEGGAWVYTQRIAPSDLSAGDRFGIAVSLSGTSALIGADRADAGSIDGGSASIYVFNGSQWSRTLKVDNPTRQDGAQFGRSVAIHNDIAVIGAAHFNGMPAGSGVAMVYRFDGLSWRLQEGMVSPSGEADDQFATSVAIDGWHVAASAPGGSRVDVHIFAVLGAADCDHDGVPDDCQEGCPEDLTGDGVVDNDDLDVVLAAWGHCMGAECPADLDGDGTVGLNDLSAVLSAFGTCPTL